MRVTNLQATFLDFGDGRFFMSIFTVSDSSWPISLKILHFNLYETPSLAGAPPMSPRLCIPIILSMLIFGSGCSSKWAIADRDYREKYRKPYPQNRYDKWSRMGKQMIDARHIHDQGGVYVKGGWSENPDAGLGEIGAYGYTDPWLSWHLGLSGLFGEERILGLPGLELGVRAQTPSRLAPFVGMGTYINLLDVAINELLDNDDPCGCPSEEYDTHSIFATVYPEVGVHYWLTSGLRVTGSAAYHLSSRGRDNDFLMLGVSFAHMNHADPAVADTFDEAEHRRLLDLEDENHVEISQLPDRSREQLFDEAVEYGRHQEQPAINPWAQTVDHEENEEKPPFCYD